MDEVTYRRGQPSDAAALVEVHHAAIQGLVDGDLKNDGGGLSPLQAEAWVERASKETISVDIKPSEDQVSFIAFLANRPMGYVCVAPGEIRHLFVVPDGTNLQVDKKLLKLAEERIFSQYSYATVEIPVQAASLYLNNGYTLDPRKMSPIKNNMKNGAVIETQWLWRRR